MQCTFPDEPDLTGLAWLATGLESVWELAFGVGEPVVEYDNWESSSEAVSLPVSSLPALGLFMDLTLSTPEDVETRFPILWLKDKGNNSFSKIGIRDAETWLGLYKSRNS